MPVDLTRARRVVAAAEMPCPNGDDWCARLRVFERCPGCSRDGYHLVSLDIDLDPDTIKDR